MADIVAQQQNARVGQIQVGRIVLMLARMSGERGIRVPPELTMLGKTLLNLDQIGRTLATASSQSWWARARTR